MTRNILIFILLAGYVASCAKPFNPPPQFAPAEKSIPIAPAVIETKGKVEAIKPPLAAATQLAPKLTPANIEIERPSLIEHLNKSWSATLAAIQSAKALESKAQASDRASLAAFERERKKDAALGEAARVIEEQNAVVADLRKKIADYRSNVITWTLRGMLVLCGLASLAGIYLLVKLDFWNGGALLATGAGGGALFIFGIRFQTEIAIAVACAIGLALMVFAYLAYRRLHEGKKSIVQANQVGIATGAINLEAMRPVYDAVETKYAKTFVNTVTPKKPKEPAHVPNLHAIANGPDNLTHPPPQTTNNTSWTYTISPDDPPMAGGVVTR
jgi:hypothetical protein